jgi:hypothetical protein
MSQLGDIRVEYGGEDEVSIIEYYDGNKYEIAKWIEDELEENPDLEDTVENAVNLAKTEPKELIKKIYGSVSEWEDMRENKSLD